MTLQQLVDNMQQYHAETGAYRPEDVYRSLGDQRRGIGLCLPASDAHMNAGSAASTEIATPQRD